MQFITYCHANGHIRQAVRLRVSFSISRFSLRLLVHDSLQLLAFLAQDADSELVMRGTSDVFDHAGE